MSQQTGILVINSGSTSLKFALYVLNAARPELAAQGGFSGMSTAAVLKFKDSQGVALYSENFSGALSHEAALTHLIGVLKQKFPAVDIGYAGHRIVLGGDKFLNATILDGENLEYLDGLSRIEPTHQHFEVEGARALARAFPTIKQSATFDTSFHRTMPKVAEFYPVPPEIIAKGVRHWGFHGISYAYISRQLPSVMPTAKKVVVAHLGGGASLCAMKDGKSIDTSMQFGAITGVPMATRSGDFPADAVFYLLKEGFYTAEGLEQELEKHSGLLGASLGLSEDMQVLEASHAEESVQALQYFEYDVLKYIGAYAAALEGLDGLVFTAGIGENDADFRARIISKLSWLGITLDKETNQQAVGGRTPHLISGKDSRIPVYVIPTNEELMIAYNVVELFNLI